MFKVSELEKNLENINKMLKDSAEKVDEVNKKGMPRYPECIPPNVAAAIILPILFLILIGVGLFALKKFWYDKRKKPSEKQSYFNNSKVVSKGKHAPMNTSASKVDIT